MWARSLLFTIQTRTKARPVSFPLSRKNIPIYLYLLTYSPDNFLPRTFFLELKFYGYGRNVYECSVQGLARNSNSWFGAGTRHHRSLLLDAYAELLDSCYCYIIMFVIFFYLKNHSFRCDFLIIPTSVHERIGNKRAKHRFKAAPLISII